MRRYELSFLGRPELRLDGEIVPVKSSKAQAVLALLAEKSGPCPRTRLSGLLWESLPESRARANLRHTLHGLNKQFPGLIEQCETSAALADGVGVDLKQDNLAELQRGPFCEGLEVRDCPTFETWLHGQRSRWRDRVLELTLGEVDSRRESGQDNDALEAAHRALRLDPLCERAHAMVIRLLRERGDLAAARRQWDLCLRTTLQELGTVPSLVSCWGPALSESAACRIYLLGTPRLIVSGAIRALPYQKTTALLAYLASQGEATERSQIRALLWPDAHTAKGAANLRHALHFLRKIVGPALCTHGDTIWLDKARFWLDTDWLESQSQAFESVGGFCEGLSLPDCPKFEAWLSQRRASLQVVASPPTPKASEESPPAGNLPASLTPLVGGEESVREALELLEDSRLMTIIGPAGVGKTRIGLEIARRLEQPRSWLVELGAMFEPEHLLTRVASVLGIGECPGEDLQEIVEKRLGQSQCLLLMDNCEHLITAVAELLSRLLQRCPALRVIATSRELLRIPGETVLALDPLSYPGPDCRAEEMLKYPAVELFVSRARAVSPRFRMSPESSAQVAAICRRLDGLPLAIELAAGRTRALSVQQIADGLKNRFRLLRGGPRTKPQRQRTLEAALAWSYDLLEEKDQEVFRNLSVFADSFDLEAATTVCDTETSAEDMIERLLGLIDRSLLVCRDGAHGFRYAMLETVRDFAFRELERGGEGEEIRERHFRLFLDRAKNRSAPGVAGLVELEQDHGNFSHCLDWALTVCPEEALELAANLGDYWFYRGHFIEGSDYLEQALENARDAKALLWSGRLHQAQGDYTRASTEFEASAELAVQAKDQARALNARAQAGFSQGDYGSSKLFAERALELWRAEGAKNGVVDTLHILATAQVCLGHWDAADKVLSEALDMSRAQGYSWGRSSGLYLSGLKSLFQGMYKEAKDRLRSSLEMCRASGNAPRTAACLGNLGLAAVGEGELGTARELFEEGLSLAVTSGYRGVEAFLWYGVGLVALRSGNRNEAADSLLQSLKIMHAIGVKESSELVLLALATAVEQPQLGAAAMGFKSQNESVVPAYLDWLEKDFPGPSLELEEAVQVALQAR